MPTYMAHVTATSNATADTEDTFIDLTAPAGQVLRLTRVRISISTAASDTRIIARIVRKTATGAGGVTTNLAETNVAGRFSGPKHFNDRAKASTVTMKDTTVAFAAGTIGDNLDRINVNARAIYEWIPRGDEEKYESATASIIGVNILASAASIVITVTVEWEE